jgi:hypothetical protein
VIEFEIISLWADCVSKLRLDITSSDADPEFYIFTVARDATGVSISLEWSSYQIDYVFTADANQVPFSIDPYKNYDIFSYGGTEYETGDILPYEDALGLLE